MDLGRIKKHAKSILSQPAWIVPLIALLSFAGATLKNLVTISSAPQQIRELQVEMKNQEQSSAVTQQQITDVQERLQRIENKLDHIEPDVIVRRFVYKDEKGPAGALTRSQVKRKK